MSRADTVKQILVLEAVSAHAKQLANEQRELLQDEAKAELEKDGTAPTWRLPSVARVTLPISTQSIEVSNADHLLEWVQHRYPAEVETVSTVRVRPSFVTALTGTLLRADEDVVIDPETGEIVPGLSVRPGGTPKALSITAERGVKAAIAAYAADMMRTGVWALPGPVVDAEPVAPPAAPATFMADGDPFALFPPNGGAQ